MPRKRYPVTAVEIEDAVNALPDEERVRWLRHVRAMIVNHALLNQDELYTLLRHATKYLPSDFVTFETTTDPWQDRDILLAMLQARNPKPRKTERDDEIVRLRDDEGKSFGEIGRLLLLKNAAWTGKGGKPLTRAAAEKAYHRRKSDPDK